MKKTAFLLLSILSAHNLFSQKTYTIDSKFSFAANDGISFTDQYELKGKLDFTFFINSSFICELGLEADKSEIDVENIIFRYLSSDYDILFGKYRNKIAAGDITSSQKSPVQAKSILENLLISQGYINRSIGAGIETNKNFSPGYLFLKASSIEAHFLEPQFNAVYLHSFPENIKAGIAGCYFPFFIKDQYLGDNSISSEAIEGDVENNFTLNLIAFRHEGTLIFGSETVFGKNIHDPIGLLYSGLYSSRDYFFGIDFYGGMRLYLDQTEIIPAARASALFPDTDRMDCNIIELSLNCKIGFTKDIRLDLAGGTRVITQYDYDENLVTSLDPLWNISFQVYF